MTKPRSDRSKKTNDAAIRHKKMVGDKHRTDPLMRAVKKCVREGFNVMDIGTGTGILAAQAAKCKAASVLAVDCDAQALECAKRLSKKEKLDGIIRFENALSFEVKTPQKFDVIICETVGSFAFDENILLTLKDAKERFLAPGGIIIPSELKLLGAPLCVLPKTDEISDTALISPKDLAGSPTLISRVDFSGNFEVEIRAKSAFKIDADCEVRAIALWPEVKWCDGEKTNASPLKPATHWSQGILPIEPRRFKRGDLARVEIIIGPHPDSPLLHTERLWRWQEE